MTVITETAYGQSTIQSDSCICYTDDQDKRCLDCLINAPLKDSNITDLKCQIEVLHDEAKNQGDKLQIANNFINSQRNTIDDLNKSIKWKNLGLGVSIGAAVVEFVYIILQSIF